MTAKKKPDAATILNRGIKCRCPKCGKGKLFQSYLKPAPKCSNCGLKFDQWVGADGPSFFVMFLVIIVVPVAALVVEMRYAPEPWVHVVLWVPLTFILSLGLLPIFKGMFVALEYKNKTDFFSKK